MGRDVRQRNKLIASAVDQHLLVLISGHAESLCSQSAENPQFFPCQSIPFTDRSVVPSASQHLRDSAVVILLPTLDPDVLLKDLVGQRFARPRAEWLFLLSRVNSLKPNAGWTLASSSTLTEPPSVIATARPRSSAEAKTTDARNTNTVVKIQITSNGPQTRGGHLCRASLLPAWQSSDEGACVSVQLADRSARHRALRDPHC